MLISTKTLTETCDYLVNACRRDIKQAPAELDRHKARYRENLRGLSLLLIGRPERNHVEHAIKQIETIQPRRAKHG
ncbi:hypothetical protein [Methylomonas sp. DH-1]|uniref:hypothetical protein n=1 Tax=Methylomonas sp. (strain DH-1) TaxID=1727196 RepID=UPI0007C9245D|nr:hypothetical protein [Methylomonas sp. DH-1]ANE57479.1 hypothetical protein AYM39_21355 [Methylomonas sp. DH-1]